MSETKERATLDLSKGVAASALADGGMILGRVGDEDVVLARSGSRAVRDRRALHALPWAARGGARRRRHGPLSVASRVLQPPHGRSAARARARSDRVLARRARGRPVFVREKLPERDRRRRRPRPRQHALVGRHRRRRRRGPGGRRHAAARRLRRPAHDDQRRCGSAGRSAESVEGLSSPAKRRTTGFRCWPPEFYVEQRIELVLGRVWRRSIRPARPCTSRRRHGSPRTARCCSRPAPIPCG